MLSLIENLKESNNGEKDFSVFGDQTALNTNDQYLKDCMIKIDALEKQIKKQDLKLNMVLDCWNTSRFSLCLLTKELFMYEKDSLVAMQPCKCIFRSDDKLVVCIH